MAPRFSFRALAGAGAAVLAALALSACGSDGSISAGGPLPDEETTTSVPTETTEAPVAETLVPDTAPEQVLPPDAGVTASVACEPEALRGAVANEYGNAEGFLVTDCVGDWASGSTRHEFDPPIAILFHAQDGSWVAVDRGNGMCSRQDVPADVARQLGCTV